MRSLRSLSRNDRVGGRAGVSLGRNDRVGGRAGVSLCRNDTVIKNVIPTVSIAPLSVISTETNEVSEAEKSFFCLSCIKKFLSALTVAFLQKLW